MSSLAPSLLHGFKESRMVLLLDRFPPWRRLFGQMCRESDTTRVTELVAQFEGAIFKRGQEISEGPEPREEWEARRRAKNSLRRFQTEPLGWPAVVANTAESGSPGMLF